MPSQSYSPTSSRSPQSSTESTRISELHGQERTDRQSTLGNQALLEQIPTSNTESPDWHLDSPWFQGQQDWRFGYCMEDPKSRHQSDVGACAKEVERWTNQPYSGAVELEEDTVVGRDPVIVDWEVKIRGAQEKRGQAAARVEELRLEEQSARTRAKDLQAQADLLLRTEGGLGKGPATEGGKGAMGARAAAHVRAHALYKEMKAYEEAAEKARLQRIELEKQSKQMEKDIASLQTQIAERKALRK